jgi:hypothetical protein
MEYEKLVNKLLTPLTYEDRKNILQKLYKINESLNKKNKSIPSDQTQQTPQIPQIHSHYNQNNKTYLPTQSLRPEPSNHRKKIVELDHPATLKSSLSSDTSPDLNPDWLTSSPTNNINNTNSINNTNNTNSKETVLNAMRRIQVLSQKLKN